MMENSPNIGMIYGKGSFDDFELESLKRQLEVYHVTFAAAPRSTYTNACLDIFVPYIQMFLSPDFVQTIVQDLATDGIRDAIKVLLSVIYAKFHNRPIKKIQPGKITEETANIQFQIGNNSLVLPVDTEMEKYRYAVDKFFETVVPTCEERTLYIYSEEENSLSARTEEQILREAYEEQLRAQQSKQDQYDH